MSWNEGELAGALRPALARGGDAYEKGCALARLAAVVRGADRERARLLLERGRAFALEVSGVGRGLVWAELTDAAVAGGEPEWAEELALGAPDGKLRLAGVLRLMRTVEGAGTRLAGRAEELLLELSDPGAAAQAAAELATLVAGADPLRGRALAEYAEGTLASVRDGERAAWVTAELAKAAVALGEPERARGLAGAFVSEFPEDEVLLLSEWVEIAASTGDGEWARALAERAREPLSAVMDSYHGVLAALELARAVRAAGDEERVRALIDEAELAALFLGDPSQAALAWTELAKTAAREEPGRADLFNARAQALIPAVPELSRRAWTLARLDGASAVEPARALLPEVLAGEPWPVCLTVVLVAFPGLPAETARTVADDLLAAAL